MFPQRNLRSPNLKVPQPGSDGSALAFSFISSYSFSVTLTVCLASYWLVGLFSYEKRVECCPQLSSVYLYCSHVQLVTGVNVLYFIWWTHPRERVWL